MTDHERFNYAFSILMLHEGGLSNHSLDPGGITKYGISLRYLKSKGIDIDLDGDSDADDIRKIKLKNAFNIYQKYWWDKYHYNLINNLQVATKILDLSVNMGAPASHKIVQKAINDLIKKPIVVDGILGKMTLAQLNGLNSDKLMDSIRHFAAKKYEGIAEANPKLRVFLKAWLLRASW